MLRAGSDIYSVTSSTLQPRMSYAKADVEALECVVVFFTHLFCDEQLVKQLSAGTMLRVHISSVSCQREYDCVVFQTSLSNSVKPRSSTRRIPVLYIPTLHQCMLV